MARFRTILADPPWHYGSSSGRDYKHGAGREYSTLTFDQLCGLRVANVAQDNAALVMWCTWPQLSEGIRLIEAWGFRYVTGFPWVKMWRATAPKRGMGFYTRSCSECVLIGVRGVGMTPKPEKRQIGIIFSPSGAHSKKPEEQYEFAEAYGGPFLEMFARPEPAGLFPPREGWTFIGNGVDGLDITDALRLLAESEK